MWHPSFFASLKLELQDYYDYLSFISEYNLNKAPRRIDVLIIILLENIKIEKNIARIFRKHNIFEYKAPDDILTENDFYNGISYALQYKSIDINNVSIEELSLSFVCFNKPAELFNHIEKRYGLTNEGAGIYYITGNLLPIQMIITSELSEDENLYLSGLRKDADKNILKRLMINKGNLPEEIHDNYIEAVANANLTTILEVMDDMKSALKEMSKEERKKTLAKADQVYRNLGLHKQWEDITKAAVEAERMSKEKAIEENKILKAKIEELEQLIN
jgi:hypothetical protein